MNRDCGTSLKTVRFPSESNLLYTLRNFSAQLLQKHANRTGNEGDRKMFRSSTPRKGCCGTSYLLLSVTPNSSNPSGLSSDLGQSPNGFSDESNHLSNLSNLSKTKTK
jgi:hypothetical protein